jgi:hypothetical protein
MGEAMSVTVRTRWRAMTNEEYPGQRRGVQRMGLFDVFKRKPVEEPAVLTPEPGDMMATFTGLEMH